MAKMFNRARMTVTSTGTGALSLGVAVAGYQTFSSAGAQNGDSVSYAVEDGLKWEIGTGTYNSVAGTLSRTVTQSFDGTTYGTSAISVTTSAQVFISPLAADLQYGTSAGNLVQLDGSARLPAVDGSLVTALNASNISSGTIAAARVPTLNQNTTGTAANVTGTVAVANGGTGLTSLTAGYIPFGGSTTYSSDSNLFWDNTNKRLGIGSVTPVTKLDVAGSVAIGYNTAGTQFEIYEGDTTNYHRVRITANSSSGIINATRGAGTPTSLIFQTDSTEKMRIASDGSVGIGTTSPAYKLDVTGAIRSSNAGNGNVWLSDGTYQSSLQQNSTDLYLNANAGGAANGGFIWRSSNSYTTRMTLDASGNLGLGVTPSAWATFKAIQVGPNALSLSLSSAGDYGVVGNNIYYNGGWLCSYTGYKPSAYVQSAGGHYWTTSSTNGTAGSAVTWSQAMTLDASGNLGVGTSSPGYKLHVSSASDMSGRFETTGTTNAASFYLASGNGTTSGKYAYARFLNNDTNQQEWRLGTYGDNNLQIVGGTSLTSFSTKLTLDTSGNVGIGNPSPGYKLDVYGSGSSGIHITGAGVDSGAYINSTGSNELLLSGGANYNSYSGNYLFTAKTSVASGLIISGGAFRFWTNSGLTSGSAFTNSEVARIDASGNLLIGSSSSGSGGKTTSVIAGSNSAITDYFLVGGSDSYRMCAFSEETSSNTFAITNKYQGTGVISFRSWNGTAIAERVRIHNSGNLSVGTNGGVGRIQASYGVGAMPSSLTAANSYLYLGGSDYGSTGNAKTAIAFGFTGNTATNAPAYLAYVEATTSGNTYGDFVFYTRNVTTDTAPTERVRIDYSGNLLVGNTSSASNYSVATFSGASKGIAIKDSTSGIYRALYISSGNLYFWNGTNEGYLSSAGAWTNASDGRLKKNIVDIKYGLETVLSTMPRSFERKDVDGEYVGFIAQELQQIIPEVVSGDPNKQLGVDYGSLVAVAFKAIQELAAKVQALEAKVA